jgi:glycosyltransferase involved in cell wall biosynthesis
VVILNHNGLPHIERIAQRRGDLCARLPGIEWILVDDNSTDGSDAALQALAAEYGATFGSTREVATAFAPGVTWGWGWRTATISRFWITTLYLNRVGWQRWCAQWRPTRALARALRG